MAVRLGEIFYLAGCGIALMVLASIVLLGAWALFMMGENGLWTILGVSIYALPVSLISWLIGRTCLYVLAGR